MNYVEEFIYADFVYSYVCTRDERDGVEVCAKAVDDINSMNMDFIKFLHILHEVDNMVEIINLIEQRYK